MKYYIEIDERDIDRFRIDDPCKGSRGNNVLVLRDKYNRTIGFELLKARLHGEWKPSGNPDDLGIRLWRTCSNCGFRTTWHMVDVLHFCPNCGSDNRKEGDPK